MKKILAVVPVLAFGALMAWATSWTVRGWVAAWRWDGESKLECYGSTVMHLRHRHARGPVEAAGNCELALDDCDLAAVSAAGNAKVMVHGGHLAALDAAGNVVVTVEGARVDRVQKSGNARITGIPAEDERQAAEDLSKRFGAGACDGVVECYESARAFGNISGRLTARVGKDGHVTDASYEGDASAPIRACLVERARGKTIAGYNGHLGILTCEWAGMMAAGSRKLMIGGGYRRAD